MGKSTKCLNQRKTRANGVAMAALLNRRQTDSHVIFGDLRFPDLGGEDWDYLNHPEGLPEQITEETIIDGSDSGMGTLNNYDESNTPIWDVYMKLDTPSDGVETVELMQLVLADGTGFSIDLTLLNSNRNPATDMLTVTTHNLNLSLPTLTAGDANGDGFVDAEDASILAQHWLQSSGATWANGDFNRDGVVNDIDATLLAANWSSQSASVPEPSTLVLLAGMLLAFCMRCVSCGEMGAIMRAT